MRWMTFLRSRGLVALTLLAFHGVPAAEGAETTTTETAYAPARRALDDAIAAMGGESALRVVRTVSRKGAGNAFNQGQSPKPDVPYTSRAVEAESILDFEGRRSVSEVATTTSGSILVRTRTVLAGDGGFTFNHVTELRRSLLPGAVNGARALLRTDPATILLTALGRAATLRSLGDGSYEGKPQRVITFADVDGAQIALYLDAATSLLTKYETLGDDAVFGDAVTEQAFSDYRPVEGVKLPFRQVTRTAGAITQDLAYSDIRLNAGLPAAQLETPPGAVAGKAPGGPGTVEVTPLANGVFFLGGSTHNSVLVVFKDHSVLLETPQGDERAQAVLAEAAKIAPDKPVRTVS